MMIRSIVFGNPANEGAAQASGCETGLTQFHGRNRVLVIFADKANTGTPEQKTLLSSAQDGLLARDVVVLLAKGQAVTPIFGEAEPIEYDKLRTRLSGPDTGRFMAVLVGKDGVVKLREREPVTPAELFQAIDNEAATAANRPS